uniref:NADH dehydrogenase [ubiquinone] 1 alpha subcomplex subunit 12 n=1 Tax=Panagrolaimus sp. JU765 TaxID=591449 RepID=A0AC34QA57_9BILA
MTQRVGPSVWARLWNNLNRAISREAEKVFIGTDSVGNKYYEYKGGRTQRSNIKRGYEPVVEGGKPPLEWDAWLKGTRRFPPSDEEIALNRQRQQQQLAEDAQTEKRAPKIGSRGKGAADVDRPKSYPKYDDLEINPGVRKTQQD